MRSPTFTAHDSALDLVMSEWDALDMMSTASLIHRPLLFVDDERTSLHVAGVD
jgi:hypothetical protein